MAGDNDDLLVLMNVVMDEEEADYEALMMEEARLAMAEIMDLEEEGLDDYGGETWERVTVFIDEFHDMGDSVFKLHFRMSKGAFEALTLTIRNHLTKRGRLQRERTPLRNIMLMVLWVLATPDSFRSVALKFGVRPTTLHYFYSYIIEALRELAAQYIRWPTREERVHIKETFERATGFPGVVGSIDGTHVFVTAPLEDAAAYRNRHHSYSLNVQAVVDSTLLVRDLHVGEVGSMHDARVFRRSPLHEDLVTQNGRLEPDEHLVGDGAYILTDYMMIPFQNNGNLNADQLRFNRKLSQSRVRVENAFGKAKGKWRRLKFLHARNQAYVVDHITASFVIHNFLIMFGEPMFDDDELGRALDNRHLLGNEPFNEGGLIAHDDLQMEAEARGIEKRTFIMNHILHD